MQTEKSIHIYTSILTTSCSTSLPAELQIRGSIEEDSKIIFLTSQYKHTLLPIIKTVSSVKTYVVTPYRNVLIGRF